MGNPHAQFAVNDRVIHCAATIDDEASRLMCAHWLFEVEHHKKDRALECTEGYSP